MVGAKTLSSLGRLRRVAFGRGWLCRVASSLGCSRHACLSHAKQKTVAHSILFISPTGDFSNGAEISVFQLMKMLVEQGNRVFNVYPAYAPGAEVTYRSALSEAGITPVRIPELRWWPDAPGGDINTVPDAPADLAAVDKIGEIISANSVDVVITNTVNIYHGALAAATKNVRHIWLIHEYPEGEFGYYRNKVPFISDSSDALFCVEGTLRACLEPLLEGRKIGTFLPYTNPGEVPDESSICSLDRKEKEHAEQTMSLHKRIVCVSLISERKNQLELLRAYALLVEELEARELRACESQVPKLREPEPREFKSQVPTPWEPELQVPELVFIGGDGDDGAYRRLCDDFIECCGLTKVSFAGHLENPWAFISERDIVVLPSKAETFGCVYAEALMCGVPVIASDNPGFVTVKRLFGAGRLYSCGDVRELVGAIREMLENFIDEKVKAVSAAPAVRDAFSAQNAYAQVIDEVASNKKPRRKKRYDAAQLRELIIKTS